MRLGRDPVEKGSFRVLKICCPNQGRLQRNKNSLALKICPNKAARHNLRYVYLGNYCVHSEMQSFFFSKIDLLYPLPQSFFNAVHTEFARY